MKLYARALALLLAVSSPTMAQVAADPANDLLVDFGDRGLWLRVNNLAWIKVGAGSPVIGQLDANPRSDLVYVEPGRGLWVSYNGSPAVRFTSIPVDAVAVGDVDHLSDDADDIVVIRSSDDLVGFFVDSDVPNSPNHHDAPFCSG